MCARFIFVAGCSEMAFPRSRSAWEGLPPEDLLFCKIWGFGQEFIREVDIDVGLTLQLGVFLQKILRLLPVLARGPADRLALGFLSAQDCHGAVDLEQRNLLVEDRGALHEDLGGLVTIVKGVLPTALRGAQKPPQLSLIFRILEPVAVGDDRAA